MRCMKYSEKTFMEEKDFEEFAWKMYVHAHSIKDTDRFFKNSNPLSLSRTKISHMKDIWNYTFFFTL